MRAALQLHSNLACRLRESFLLYLPREKESVNKRKRDRKRVRGKGAEAA